MPFLPPKTTRVRTGLTVGADTNQPTRIQDQIGTTVDLILRMLNTLFSYVGNTLTFLTPVTFNAAVSFLNVTVRGTLTVLGVTSLQALTAVTGTFSGALSAASGAFVGAVTAASATITGTVTGNSFVSAQGFKSQVGPFAYAGLGSTLNGMTYGDWGTTTFDAPTYGWVAPYAGSIIAISGRFMTATVKTSGLVIYKNLANTGWAVSGPTNTTVSSQRITQPKGTWTFAAGDIIGLAFTSSVASGAEMVTATLTVEMGA